MLDAEDDYDLQTIFAIDEVQTLIYETGFRKPLLEIKLKDKREVISILIDYNCMVKVKGAIDQFCVGLQCLTVLQRIQANPSRWKEFFVASTTAVSAGTLIEFTFLMKL